MPSNTTGPQPLIDARVADLGRAVLDQQMVDRDEPWIYDLGAVDGHELVIAVNNGEPNIVEPDGCMEIDMAPFQMIIWDNGWAAYRGPCGKRHMGPEEAEHRWIDALENEIEAHGGDLTPEADDGA